MKNAYIPGVCNIGSAEIRYRRRAGIIGLIVTIILFALFTWLNVTPILKSIIFLPATLTAVGFLQAQLHFCVKFGMSGLFNFSDDITKQESVDQKEYRRKDQQKAVAIIVGSVVIGITVTIVCLLV